MPVAGVSWDDATAYAAWLSSERYPGARMCTEREWERAGRGADERVYPWGDEAHPGDDNCQTAYPAHQNGEDAVASFPMDRSPLGVFDLGGNLAEWVTYATDNPAANGHGSRGGDFTADPLVSRCSGRHANQEERRSAIGIRVCISATSR